MTRNAPAANALIDPHLQPPQPTIGRRGENLDVVLAQVGDSSVNTMLALGANPNGIVDEATGLTALGQAISKGGTLKGRVMLLALADRDEAPVISYGAPAAGGDDHPGERGPASTYFDWALNTAGRGSNNGPGIRMFDLARHLQEVFDSVTMPPSWKRAIGESFLRFGTENEFWRGEGRVEIFFDLLMRADFDDSDRLVKAISVVAEDLIKQDKTDAVATLAKRLVDMGGHPDQVMMTYTTGIWGPRPCTWLHGAARRGQGELVRQLLELGADPALGSDNGAGPNAYDLVLGSNHAKSVLDAWKAKTTVESVIRGAGRSGELAAATP